VCDADGAVGRRRRRRRRIEEKEEEREKKTQERYTAASNAFHKEKRKRQTQTPGLLLKQKVTGKRWEENTREKEDGGCIATSRGFHVPSA
jgi:hypothetical protein